MIIDRRTFVTPVSKGVAVTKPRAVEKVTNATASFMVRLCRLRVTRRRVV